MPLSSGVKHLDKKGQSIPSFKERKIASSCHLKISKVQLEMAGASFPLYFHSLHFQNLEKFSSPPHYSTNQDPLLPPSPRLLTCLGMKDTFLPEGVVAAGHPVTPVDCCYYETTFVSQVFPVQVSRRKQKFNTNLNAFACHIF